MIEAPIGWWGGTNWYFSKFYPFVDGEMGGSVACYLPLTSPVGLEAMGGGQHGQRNPVFSFGTLGKLILVLTFPSARMIFVYNTFTFTVVPYPAIMTQFVYMEAAIRKQNAN